MRHIAFLLGAVFLAIFVAGFARGGVELGRHADSADQNELIGVAGLPEGHPPVLPPGHPPLLPHGHPPVPGMGTRCPGSELTRGWQPEPDRIPSRDTPAIISI